MPLLAEAEQGATTGRTPDKEETMCGLAGRAGGIFAALCCRPHHRRWREEAGVEGCVWCPVMA